MRGRDFLAAANQALSGAVEPCWRTACIDAYYALFLECRDALGRWGFIPSRRDAVHAWVRLRFTYATDRDLNQLGDTLDDLGRVRNRASYDLNPSALFASATEARRTIQDANAALVLLDQIDGDATRRAAAIASLPP
jgi:hypothetical protein